MTELHQFVSINSCLNRWISGQTHHVKSLVSMHIKCCMCFELEFKHKGVRGVVVGRSEAYCIEEKHCCKSVMSWGWALELRMGASCQWFTALLHGFNLPSTASPTTPRGFLNLLTALRPYRPLSVINYSWSCLLMTTGICIYTPFPSHLLLPPPSPQSHPRWHESVEVIGMMV